MPIARPDRKPEIDRAIAVPDGPLVFSDGRLLHIVEWRPIVNFRGDVLTVEISGFIDLPDEPEPTKGVTG